MAGGPYGSPQLAAAACSSDPRCAGFNSAGYTKSTAWPLDPSQVDARIYPGFCIHVKIGAWLVGWCEVRSSRFARVL